MGTANSMVEKRKSAKTASNRTSGGSGGTAATLVNTAAHRNALPLSGVRNAPSPVAPVEQDLNQQLIVDYMPVVKHIANRFISRLPSSVMVDDLISAGLIGLMDAIHKFDPTRDNKFKTYAEFRIRGAILDELRRQDWLPRSVRETHKQEERARVSLEQELGRPPSDSEIAGRLNLRLEEFQHRTGITRVSVFSLEEYSSNEDGERRSLIESLENPHARNPFLELASLANRSEVLRAIRSLPHKQNLVITLYYFEELNLKEIAKNLEVTESRVSQLHGQALQSLKKKLGGMAPPSEAQKNQQASGT